MPPKKRTRHNHRKGGKRAKQIEDDRAAKARGTHNEEVILQCAAEDGDCAAPTNSDDDSTPANNGQPANAEKANGESRYVDSDINLQVSASPFSLQPVSLFEDLERPGPCLESSIMQAERRKRYDAERYRVRKANEYEELRRQRVDMMRQRAHECRDAETEPERRGRLAQKCLRQRKTRATETETARRERLAQKSVRTRRALDNELEMQREARLSGRRLRARARRDADRRCSQVAAALEATQQAEEAELAQTQRVQEEDDEGAAEVAPDLAPVGLVRTHLAAAGQDVEVLPQHSCGAQDKVCCLCGARLFKGEKSSICCHNGKVRLDILFPYPDVMFQLLTGNDDATKNFRKHIRAYNSSLSFASVGAKIDVPRGRGPYCFRVHGNIQHNIANVGQRARPLYSHLYFIDADEARSHRESRLGNEELLPNVLSALDAAIREVNPFAHGLKMLGQLEAEERAKAEAEGRPMMRAELRILHDRRRRHELPTSHDVAVVFESDADGGAPYNRDIRIHTKDGRFQQLSKISPNTDPMCYVIIFPGGDPGFQLYMPHTRNSANGCVTLLEFYSYRLQEREGQFNPILHAGKLTQQFIVDAYIKVESNRLEYMRKNQKKLRAEMYSGLMDHINNRAEREGLAVGKMVILPSTFIGSPRHMQQLYQDAMSIVTKFGKPDLLLTMTCNPKWPEIQNSLLPFENAADRPDLTARVFQLKLKELMTDLTKRHVLGVPVAQFHVVEFQKRGLPHAHILIILREEDKIRTPEQVDAIICAELPDPVTEPRLHAIVTRSMIHGPCGARKPGSVCMEDGKCQKKYPKAFAEESSLSDDGFTVYRRRDNGRLHMIGNVAVDNRDVVPYNKYLSSKYDCHLNVEHCGSAKSVKYLCKYVYKGHDCARVQLRVSMPAEADGNQRPGAQGQPELEWDEISQFIDTRFVSAPEAVWRIFAFKMHDKSHSIIRLAIHLEGEHTVVFQDGEEAAAAERGANTMSTLTAWFLLNQTNPEARRYKYMEIPYHYVFKRRRVWEPRQQGNIIGRMYSVSPRQIERYHLRLLLLHVTGATSYEDVRTHQGTVYASFKEAAIARNLLTDDDEWMRCLQEAAALQMPYQLRQLFAVICAFCEPREPVLLWEKFKDDFCEDFARDTDPIEAEQMALNAIQSVLALHRLTNAEIGLPVPREPVVVAVEDQFDQATERLEAETNVAKLNDMQRVAFDEIMTAIDDPNAGQRCFYIDGPGGSGKTFLYNTLISTLRARGERAVAVAWTGIAATLLKGGRTCHSRFRLPVPIVETSTSGVKPSSKEGAELRAAKVIVLDEGPMAPKLALEAIERVLRDVANTDRPFGGKVILIGGDFRQCLPVVKNGNRTTIIEQCIKRSTLWPLFRTLELRANMRANAGEDEFAEWLLRVGNGELLNDHRLPVDTIALPEQCVVASVVDAVFGKIITPADMSTMLDSAILCPKNAESLVISDSVLDRLEGEMHEYCSADSVECGEGDDEDALASDYPLEYLNSLTPTGMPPHKLRLKVHAVVMLLRNINVRAGLCNGTRLSVVALHQHVIDCRIIGGRCAGDRVFLSRVNLMPSDVGLPFTLKRRQFPIRLAFAMTINKAQGQSFQRVGIHLARPVFGHGQLYVALSRARSLDSVFVSVVGNEAQGKLIASSNTIFTKNVVYQQILDKPIAMIANLFQPMHPITGSLANVQSHQPVEAHGASRSRVAQTESPNTRVPVEELIVTTTLSNDALTISDDEDEPKAAKFRLASYNQADHRYRNAGKQCTAIAACAVALANAQCPSTWRRHTLDTIMADGDTLYSLSMQNLPGEEEYLSVHELHDEFVVCGLTTLIFVDTDGVVDGVIKPLNSSPNGKFETLPDLITGMAQFFSNASYGILTAAAISVAVGITNDGLYWMFDSHSRNNLGLQTAEGKACLAMSPNLFHLCELFEKNVISLSVQQYTIEKLEVIDQSQVL